MSLYQSNAIALQASDEILNCYDSLNSCCVQSLSIIPVPGYPLNFPIGILGQVWYLIISDPDLCILTYFVYLQSNLVASKSRDQKFTSIYKYFEIKGVSLYVLNIPKRIISTQNDMFCVFKRNVSLKRFFYAH